MAWDRQRQRGRRQLTAMKLFLKKCVESPAFWIVVVLVLIAVLVFLLERPSPYMPLHIYDI